MSRTARRTSAHDLAPRPGRVPLLALGGAALLAVLVFLNSLGGAFVYDDNVEIRDNPDLRSLSFVYGAFTGKPWGAERGYGYTYRPLSWSAGTVLYRLGGGSPLPFHAANVLLHGLNTFLLGLLAYRLLAASVTRSSMAPPVAVATAFLFATHPVHAEVVAWASGRSDLMATFFLLAAWIGFATWNGGLRWQILWSGLFLLSLFCKETAAAGLLLMPLSIASLAFAGGETTMVALRRIPFRALLLQIAAFVLYLTARFAALGQIGRGSIRGALMLNPLTGAGPVDRTLTAIALLGDHARLLLWPARMSVEYSFDQIPVVKSVLEPAFLLPGAAVLLTAMTLAWSRPLWWRIVLPLAGLYAAAALPTSNLLPPPAAIFAERYLYLPSAIACVAAALALCHWNSLRRPAGVALLTVMVLTGSWRAMTRSHDWRDPESLYRTSIAAAPRAARLHYNLGVVLRDQGRPREAEAAFGRALQIAPEYADARAERGVALIALSRLDEAVRELQAAATEAGDDPIILNDLGGAYLSIGKAEAALPLLKRAISIDPRNADALSNLGKAALDLGDAGAARAAFDAALAIDPNEASFHVGKGAALASGGDLAGAILSFRSALALAPGDDDAAFNLARALLKAGDSAAARAILEKLSVRHPGDAEIARMLRAAGARP